MPIQKKNTPPYYEFVADGEGGKLYQALLTQTGTNAPTVTIENNTIGNIVWTRAAQGVYTGTLTGAFTENKTYVTTGTNPTVVTGGYSGTENEVTVTTRSAINAAAMDSGLTNTVIEIRVYE